MLSEKGQQIYTTYQRIVGEGSEKPFRYRRDFDAFETERPDAYLSVLKLEKIFESNTNVNMELFFRAPFILHPAEKRHISIDEYTRPRAISDYALCASTLKHADVIETGVKEVILDSLLYIKNYCVEHKMLLTDYIDACSELNHKWITDYAVSRVSKWVVLGFDLMGYDTRAIIKEDCGSDECDMMNITPYLDNFEKWKTTLLESSEYKALVCRGLELIQEFLKKTLDGDGAKC